MVVEEATRAGDCEFNSQRIEDLVAKAYRQLGTAPLYEYALRHGEGRLAATGPLVVETGQHTGRSPNDKYVVEDDETRSRVDWGDVNQRLSPDTFNRLADEVVTYLKRRQLFGERLRLSADPRYQVPVCLITDQAWAALFARNLFIVPDDTTPGDSAVETGFTILHAPGFRADPERHGVRSETVIALDLSRRLIVIAGTQYAGEIKKAMFTVLQYLLPLRSVATMHCSANTGESDDVALFFGLSGTGKTTLSTDPSRHLIGDDEHGWSDDGIFNFEGGSYAKVINLSPEKEPDIWRASHRFGTVLENVVIDPDSREIRPEDDSLTENTRAAFPLTFIDGISPSGRGGHPRNIVLLTADAFGVLPPVARLSRDQALYWFLSGYTSKLAGTERGVDEPEATFSACFGSPFLPLPAVEYARLLGDRIDAHQPAVWLVNTGWSGGSSASGERMPIALTRSVIRSILDGSLAAQAAETDPFFGFAVPVACAEVSPEVLEPKQAWHDGDAYDRAARRLATSVVANFQQFAGQVSPQVAAARPTITAR